LADADAPKAAKKGALAWRAWLRASHRDVGYLLVGLTFVYALSGIAVNHVDDWNANHVEFETTHTLGPLPTEDDAAVAAVKSKLGIEGAPSDVYRASDDELEIQFDQRTLVVTLSTGSVHDRGREPRFFIHVANWLHLNRHKKAWTYFADGYAILLLMLATSGMFMIKGKKGLWGRGAVLVVVGSAVPILYVVLSGGP
jgi:hypothetical protein